MNLELDELKRNLEQLTNKLDQYDEKFFWITDDWNQELSRQAVTGFSIRQDYDAAKAISSSIENTLQLVESTINLNIRNYCTNPVVETLPFNFLDTEAHLISQPVPQKPTEKVFHDLVISSEPYQHVNTLLLKAKICENQWSNIYSSWMNRGIALSNLVKLATDISNS